MNEASRPAGIELLPNGMSDSALKKQVAPLLKIQYDFLVVFTKYSEDLFWESFSDPNVTNTARVVIPDIDCEHNYNPGYELLRRREFSIHYKGNIFISKWRNHKITKQRLISKMSSETRG